MEDMAEGEVLRLGRIYLSEVRGRDATKRPEREESGIFMNH